MSDDRETLVGAAIDKELRRAEQLPDDELEVMRHRAFFSDEEDGVMVIPSFYGDADLGRLIFQNFDMHEHADCPLELWFKRDMEEFAKALNWNAEQLQNMIRVECVGAPLDQEPELCKVSITASGCKIAVDHVQYHVALVAARATAARVRLSENEPRDVEAKEINDSLRAVFAIFDGREASPTTDAITAKLLPHQVLVVDRLARGMRRFMIAHGLGHVHYWNLKRGSVEETRALDRFLTVATSMGAPPHRVKEWASELFSDVVGTEFLTSQASNAENVDAAVRLAWDYAGYKHYMTAWSHIRHRMKAGGVVASDEKPSPELRMEMAEVQFPDWSKKFGADLGDALHHRLANI